MKDRCVRVVGVWALVAALAGCRGTNADAEHGGASAARTPSGVEVEVLPAGAGPGSSAGAGAERNGGTSAPTPEASPDTGLRELFPGVRADLRAHVVEFDARVSPMMVGDDKAPVIFLEVICCTPNTREHESLLVTNAKPSLIHAALLAAGFKPGAPGGWKFENEQIVGVPPTGDGLRITFGYTGRDGHEQQADPGAWVVNLATREPIVPKGTPARFVFAGSKIIERAGEGAVYDADGSGQVIGLHTFGSEVIAWPKTMHHEAQVQAPEWVADLDSMPPAGTVVKVRITGAP